MNNIEKIIINRYKDGITENIYDSVIVERILNLYVNGRHFSSLMYTPGDEEEFIAGFLYSQGVIKEKKNILKLEFRGENIAMITLSKDAVESYADMMALTSGCSGGSMKLSFIESGRCNYVYSNHTVSCGDIIKNMKHFNSLSALFKETGGVHGCALYSDNELIVMREDIGRHNAADKVIGFGIVNNIDLSHKMLYITGRVSSDIVIKTSLAGIPVLVSHSAPSDMAVRLASASNITLVGFVRGNRMNIYWDGGRLCN